MLDQISRTEDEKARDEYEKLRGKLLEDIKNRKNEKEKAQTSLQKTQQSSQSFNRWQKNLESLFQALESGDVEIRLKMQAHLKEFINRIDVYGKGGEDTIDHICEIIFECGTGNKLSKNFMRYIRKQCLSAKDAFIKYTLKIYLSRGKRWY